MSSYETGPKAKKMYYNGEKFDSNLESKTAEALDDLDIPWEYHRQGCRSRGFPGGQYTPDFYLPGLSAYVEVAGVWDETHRVRAELFIKLMHCYDWDASFNDIAQGGAPRFVAVDGQGALHAVDGLGQPSSLAYLARCPRCGARYIAADSGNWGCPICGDHSGNRPLLGSNLFALGEAAHGE